MFVAGVYKYMAVGRPKINTNKKSPGSKLATTNQRVNTMNNRMARNIDDLALHDELMGGLLGSLKSDVARGMTTDQILKKYSTLAAARTVQTALTHEDAGLALAASKDIIDRTQGKAKETKEIKHALANSSEEEVDALLLSKLNELEVASDEDEE